MKKLFKTLLVCFAFVLPVLAVFSSCSDSSSTSTQYISDEQRDAHILELMGGNENKLLSESKYKKMTNTDVKQSGITGTVDMCKVLENSKFQLYLNFENTAIAIYDKTTKAIYHSDPKNMGNDMQKDSPIISSPLALEAYDIMNKRYEFNFIENSLDDQNFKIVENGENSIRIIYTIGNDPDKDLVPPVITEKTYDWIVEQLQASGNASKQRYLEDCYSKVSPDKLSPDIRESYLKDFPTLDYMTMYVRRNNLTAKQKDFVKQAMEAAGFTVEMLKEEMEKAEYQGPERAVMYTIPVDITLENDGITVDVDTSLILAPSKQKLYKIYLYRGLGAIKSTSKTDGVTDEYMLIPDGSGAIMPIGGNITTDAYSERIYGNDETFASDVQTTNGAQVLTGFAALDRNGRGSMMAILEEGGPQAFITARPYNATNTFVASLNYDLVYSERDYRTYAGSQGSSSSTTTTTSGDSSGSGVVLAKDEAIANFKVKYVFGEGGKTYADYAVYYRDYLKEKGLLPEKTKTDAVTTLYLDFMGAVEKSESVAGIPVVNLKPLTTYNQISEILQSLKKDGVNNVDVRYSYWNNSGYYNLVNNKVRLMDILGSESELKDLISYCDTEKIGFYPSSEFMYVYKDTLTDGLNYTNDAARRLDMRLARVNSRSFATGIMASDGSSYKTVLSPDILPQIGQAYKDSYEKTVGHKQISFGSIGKYIDSNYKTNRMVNRTKSLEYQMQLVDLFQDYDKLFETGNDYVWNLSDHIINLPIGSSEYLSTTKSVPFIQMVLHGYVSYAGDYLNIKADYETALLKCLETGSNLSFRWMYESDTIFENTDYNNFYSLNYQNTYDKAVSLYQELSESLDKVASLEITDHITAQAYLPGATAVVVQEEEGGEEEQAQPEDTRVSIGNVFATTYGGKYTVYVNYNDFQVALDDGTVIEAMGYLWR